MNALRRLAPGGTRRDALWLFGSQVVAIVVTFIATPIQLERMGSERYGVVVVLSAAIGYAGLLDIGAGWAVVRFVPWHRTREDDDAAQRVVTAAVVLSLAIGVLLGAVVFGLAEPLSGLLDVSRGTEAETIRALRITALSIPVLLLVALFAGLGRAVGLFPLVGLVSAGQVVALNVVWLEVAGTSDDVVKVLVAQLLIGCAAVVVSGAVIKGLRTWALRPRIPRWETFREITSFGAKTSSGQAGLGLLIAADKPVLGSVIPVAAVPFYSIPFALAMRITLVSSSVSSAVFPPAVAALASGDDAEFARLRDRAFAVVGLVSGLLAVNCAVGGEALLDWWLGADFAADGWQPLAILGVGFGVLASGSIGNVLLDAAGRPGLAAGVMVAGGAGGLFLCGALAAIWESPLAASVGTGAGLLAIGLCGVELARRLVVPVGRARSFARVLGSWLPLGATGIALRGACQLADAPSIVTVLVVAAGTAAVAAVIYRSISRARVGRPATTPAA